MRRMVGRERRLQSRLFHATDLALNAISDPPRRLLPGLAQERDALRDEWTAARFALAVRGGERAWRRRAPSMRGRRPSSRRSHPPGEHRFRMVDLQRWRTSMVELTSESLAEKAPRGRAGHPLPDAGARRHARGARPRRAGDARRDGGAPRERGALPAAPRHTHGQAARADRPRRAHHLREPGHPPMWG